MLLLKISEVDPAKIIAGRFPCGRIYYLRRRDIAGLNLEVF
ncbi:hypothetical protein GGD55_000820 [Rhizobium giardinii]|uniref:Uncharacterized protein n=1 Tax=Rhizobium giardinii TaxID=56731 RepID=A0A7W8U794_9HYPH|nr:hypothetical protein [Rhizobium giardinii]